MRLPWLTVTPDETVGALTQSDETDFRVNLKNETNKRLDVLERAARNDRVRTESPAKIPGGLLAG